MATFSTRMSRSYVTLPTAQLRMHLGGLGVDEPGLQGLAVAGEQRVRQRAVTPEHAMAVQFHHQACHAVQEPRTVLGLVRRQPHEQPAVLPGPLEVAGDQDRGVERGLQHQAGRTHRGELHLLEPAQDVVLLGGDPSGHVLDRPQQVVGLDELHEVTAGSHGDVAQWNVGDVPLRQRSVPRQCEQTRSGCPEPELRCTHARLLLASAAVS